MEVLLNVYDLHQANKYVYWLGLGAYHAGVELNGLEWSFGGGDFDSSGVFSSTPRSAEGATYRETINMGVTPRTSREIEQIFAYLHNKYRANTYNMLGNNCITFADELCYLLVGKHIPQWLGRLPTIANTFSMYLPDSITGGQETIARQEEVQKRNALINPPVAPLAFSGTGHSTSGATSVPSDTYESSASSSSSSSSHQETPEEAAARREKIRQAALKRQQQQQQQHTNGTSS